MITINLLPSRASRQQRKKRSKIRAQLVIGVGVMLLSATICWVWGVFLLQQRDDLQKEKNSIEHMLAAVVTNNQTDESFRERQGQLRAYVEFLTRNDEEKYFSVFALDEISKSLEPLGVWLIALSVDQQDVVIEGKALSRKDIGRFIENIEESEVFGKLVKMETQLHGIIRGEVIRKFSLQFTTQT